MSPGRESQDGASDRRSAPPPFEGPWPAGEDIVAVGGTLAPALVLDAYRHGVFPFHDASQPVLWWCPDPRAILPLDGLHVPRRLARRLRQADHEIRVDTVFERVMRACDERRPDGSWIHEGMVEAYTELHRRGHAHCLEVWQEGALVGGIYGVAVGGAFAAESMFHRVRDMSKVALVHLVGRLLARGYGLLDVQFLTPHLQRFGAIEIKRDEYLQRLRACRDAPVVFS